MLTLRPATEADAPAIAAIYAPIVAETAISFELEPPDAAEMAGRIAATLQGHPWLVADDGRGAVAYAYASSFRSRAAYRFVCESTVYVGAEARGRGVGARLYRALFELLRAQGFAMVYAGIALPNEPSVRLHEAVGFERLGVFDRAGWKLGRWHDVGFWQLSLAPPGGDPREPVPWSTLRSDPAVAATLAAG